MLRAPSSWLRSSNLRMAVVIALAALAALAMNASTPVAVPQAEQPAPKQTVFITGANRGLGLEFARQYHAAGWNVIGTARQPDEARELKGIGGDVKVIALDVTSDDSVAAMAKSLAGQPVDLLINNAGVGSGGAHRFENVKASDVERVMQVNAIGPMRVTQALLPNLRAGNGKVIVSITSGLGSIANNTRGGFYGYRESKAALNMFVRSIAAELAGEGFKCIVMSPGWVQTDMGGPEAQLTPQQSIGAMRKVIDALKPEDSGKFWNYDGEILPW